MATRNAEISLGQRKQLVANINGMVEARDYTIVVKWQGQQGVLQGISPAGRFLYLMTEGEADVDMTREIEIEESALWDLAVQVFSQVDLRWVSLNTSIGAMVY